MTINGTTHYLWRAVDQHGNVLAILGVVAPPRGGGQAVFPGKLLKGLRYVPRVIVTDKLASYQVDSPSSLLLVGDPSPLEVPEQPGRELPSADRGRGNG